MLVLTNVLVLLLCFGASRATAEDRQEHITVRAYNMVGIASRQLTDALRAVDVLLSSVNVGVRWRVCRIEGERHQVADDPCSEPLKVDELIVRLVRAPRRFAEVEELGFSYVDADRRMGTLATVFADRVQALALQANTPAGVLIGSAMAHELGHLLLGTNEHSEEGLMRSHWAVRSGRLNQGRRWEFSMDDAVAIRRAAAARSADRILLAASIPHP